MKVHFLFESEQESAEREAVMDCELYRGTPDPVDAENMIRIPIRTDRRPRDAEHSAQIIFNAFFEMAHGVKDVRSRSMFCSTSWLDATAYTSDSYGHGSTLRVYPLKTGKAAFIQDKRDSLDYIEGIGIRFIRSLKELFGKDEEFERLTLISQKVVHALNNGPVENCLEQVNTALDAVRKVCTEQELPAIEKIIQMGVQSVSPYQIVQATELAQITARGSDLELMIFDAPYFYAQVQRGDPFSYDDETISGQDVDDDGIPL